jgi:hypothetical protein
MAAVKRAEQEQDKRICIDKFSKGVNQCMMKIPKELIPRAFFYKEDLLATVGAVSMVTLVLLAFILWGYLSATYVIYEASYANTLVPREPFGPVPKNPVVWNFTVIDEATRGAIRTEEGNEILISPADFQELNRLVASLHTRQIVDSFLNCLENIVSLQFEESVIIATTVDTVEDQDDLCYTLISNSSYTSNSSSTEVSKEHRFSTRYRQHRQIYREYAKSTPLPVGAWEILTNSVIDGVTYTGTLVLGIAARATILDTRPF